MSDESRIVTINLDNRSGPGVVIWSGETYTIFWDSSSPDIYAQMDMRPVERAVMVARLREVANQLEDLSRVDVE